MISQVQVLEEVARVAPFGVRFWDVSTAQPAEPGLSVVAYPPAFPELRTTAAWNGSGTYSFSYLPGLLRAEIGAGDDAYWLANPPSLAYTIEVSDPSNRYLPFVLPVLLPYHGLYGLYASPLLPVQLPDPTWIPIFPTPARPLAGVMGTIRADLQDTTGAPAAWAMITAQAPGSAIAIGVADERGVVTLPLPYPELQTFTFSSPQPPAPLTLNDQAWPITIRVFSTAYISADEYPDLQDVLQQSEASVWRDTAQSAPAGPFTLQFGKDLILRSIDASTGRELPYLLVTRAQSPL